MKSLFTGLSVVVTLSMVVSFLYPHEGEKETTDTKISNDNSRNSVNMTTNGERSLGKQSEQFSNTKLTQNKSTTSTKSKLITQAETRPKQKKPSSYEKVLSDYDGGLKGSAQKKSVSNTYLDINTLVPILNLDFCKRNNIPKSVIKSKLAEVNNFINAHRDLADKEERLHGIPSDVTLAQALLESGCGKSSLAVNHNNYFGLKCFSKNCEKNHCVNYHDDSPKDRFIRFKNVEESFEAHSKRLINTKRYNVLFTYGKNTKKWTQGLETCGYATSKRYNESLDKLIEYINSI